MCEVFFDDLLSHKNAKHKCIDENYGYSFNMQETSFDLADTESLKEKVLQVLKQIHEEKDEEMIQVDMWCHFGHAYVTKVDEGDKLRSLLLFALRKRTKFS